MRLQVGFRQHRLESPNSRMAPWRKERLIQGHRGGTRTRAERNVSNGQTGGARETRVKPSILTFQRVMNHTDGGRCCVAGAGQAAPPAVKATRHSWHAAPAGHDGDPAVAGDYAAAAHASPPASQRPFQTGSRFSAKARAPSLASSLSYSVMTAAIFLLLTRSKASWMAR
jgi:hypothetical protein